MQIYNTKIKISMNKIKMVRPETNPTSCKINLNVDWNIEYKKKQEDKLEYTCTLDGIGEMPLKLAIQGSVECKNINKNLEKNYENLSQHILDNTMNTLIKMVNVTKDTIFTINTIPIVQLKDNSKITQLKNI